MTHYLLDTSVVSLLAPGRPEASPDFRDWFARQDRNLFMSTISVTEVEQGIAKLRRSGAKRAAILSDWFAMVVDGFGPNAIAPDVTIARLAGQMADHALSIGRPPEMADILIAATGKWLGGVVLTRNLKHFVPLGVDAIDPLVTLPD